MSCDTNISYCQFCPGAKQATYTAKTQWEAATICQTHADEFLSDLGAEVAVSPLNPESQSAYEVLEEAPDEGSPLITAHGATLAERYGTPWPVSGDHVRRMYGYRHDYNENTGLSSVAQGSGFL